MYILKKVRLRYVTFHFLQQIFATIKKFNHNVYSNILNIVSNFDSNIYYISPLYFFFYFLKKTISFIFLCASVIKQICRNFLFLLTGVILPKFYILFTETDNRLSFLSKYVGTTVTKVNCNR